MYVIVCVCARVTARSNSFPGNVFNRWEHVLLLPLWLLDGYCANMPCGRAHLHIHSRMLRHFPLLFGIYSVTGSDVANPDRNPHQRGVHKKLVLLKIPVLRVKTTTASFTV